MRWSGYFQLATKALGPAEGLVKQSEGCGEILVRQQPREP
jgi:hypothetical protein